MPNDEAVKLATDELAAIGLIDAKGVLDGVKIAVPKAYPMYDREYRGGDAARLPRRLPRTLETFDATASTGTTTRTTSMWTAILATMNLLDGAGYDVRSVNTEEEYPRGRRRRRRGARPGLRRFVALPVARRVGQQAEAGSVDRAFSSVR